MNEKTQEQLALGECDLCQYGDNEFRAVSIQMQGALPCRLTLGIKASPYQAKKPSGKPEEPGLRKQQTQQITNQVVVEKQQQDMLTALTDSIKKNSSAGIRRQASTSCGRRS